MVKNNFHKDAFDDATKSKLEIFKEYFKESFPVFVHSKTFDEIYIYDFFAGQGQDISGEYGTALNILKEIKFHCKDVILKHKQIYLILNDKKEFETLEGNVKEFLVNCRSNCQLECILKEEVNLIIRSRDFDEYFQELFPKLKRRPHAAKLIFLDPFNFIIDKGLFGKLIDLPATDFICFMPSSFLLRFPEEPAFKRYIDTKEIHFETSIPAHCHRTIANYFKSLIPKNKEYYIGCFSIKKGSNYYGLLFGSNHSLGAEKFQRVCWKKDSITGEADYNIDRELAYIKEQGMLFEEHKISVKVQSFKELLKMKILNREIVTDLDAYKFALINRCLIKHSAIVLKELMQESKIQKFITINSDIHKLKTINNIIVL